MKFNTPDSVILYENWDENDLDFLRIELNFPSFTYLNKQLAEEFPNEEESGIRFKAPTTVNIAWDSSCCLVLINILGFGATVYRQKYF